MAFAPSIQSVSKNAQGHEIFTFDSGATLDAGVLPGYNNASINGAGHLILTGTDNSTLDAGPVPGAGGYPRLVLTASASLTAYALKSTDLVGAFLFVFIDATANSFTFTIDAALLDGSNSTPSTTKLVIVKRLDNTSNGVTIAEPSGETIDVASTASESGLQSLNISAVSPTRLVRW